ncbi:SDR family oxidoreductase [Phanerochaete sordida]|uniref:SDR family oxidoreductase n=1 Tax=Phanerochaete sordida TaxID=48140 RepID=A0A9P3L762_9APHY|nr:SDR family oxidoreductase [Phanerochaete sordida]
MSRFPFVLICPASRGLGHALARHYLRTTNLPVFATHRADTPTALRETLLSGMHDVDPERLHTLRVELASEASIARAAESLANQLPARGAHLHTAFFAGGVLHPERRPADLDAAQVLETFTVNTVAHLLCIKHFARFLPKHAPHDGAPPAKWVHVSARVGSVSDNHLGGWYSYRASKAALNQVVRTFDLHLETKKLPAICVGVHPGTVKTDFSKEFWNGVPKEKLFEPEYAAERLVEVVGGLKDDQRGRIWDWKGEEVKS